MANTKFSTSSINQGLVKSRSMLVGNTFYDPAAFFLIQRTSPTTGTTVTFSSIPQTYKSLQIRCLSRDAATQDSGILTITFNSDTATNYSHHRLIGDAGGGVTAGGTANATGMFGPRSNGNTATASCFGAGIIDILDYASTSKNKTIRVFSGNDGNFSGGSYTTGLLSGLWRSTSAVTSVTITASGNFVSGSTFALYGMVG